MVLGHDNCGAITATKEAVDSGDMPGGFLRNLVERITPSVLASRRDGGQDVNDFMVEHIKQTALRLVEASLTISSAVERHEVSIVGLAYHLDEGRAELVNSIGTL